MTVPILVGAASFFILLASDHAEARGRACLKRATVITASLAFVLASAALLAAPEKLTLPLAVRIAGVVLSLPFLGLLVSSLFLEVSAGARRHEGNGKKRLVTTGTYALVRHPGVLWLFFLHVCLVGASASVPFFVALPFWTAANVLLALVQDRTSFPLLFGVEYREYRHRVPFLVPTAASIRRCLATAANRRSHGGSEIKEG